MSVTIFFQVPFPIPLCFLLIEVLLNIVVSVEKCYISFQRFTFRNICKTFDNILEIRLYMYIVIFATKHM